MGDREEKLPLSGARVLVVDDYEPLRYLKARILLKAGAEVREAGTAGEALQILGSEEIALALLDVNLPDMSAVELCRQVRANPAISSLPMIFTSASERDPEMASGEVFFQEPLNTADLITAIRKALSSFFEMR